jgi:hypothetical protein
MVNYSAIIKRLAISISTLKITDIQKFIVVPRRYGMEKNLL